MLLAGQIKKESSASSQLQRCDGCDIPTSGWGCSATCLKCEISVRTSVRHLGTPPAGATFIGDGKHGAHKIAAEIKRSQGFDFSSEHDV